MVPIRKMLFFAKKKTVTVISSWLMGSGFWDDTKAWDDNQTWNG